LIVRRIVDPPQGKLRTYVSSASSTPPMPSRR
jgi:hypothetical protein